MKYSELRLPEAGDKVPYSAAYYDNLRLTLNAIHDPHAREHSIHFSYCMQNLHKNFEEKIKSLLVTYNKTKQLPHTLYFEPKATSFPIKKDKDGNKLSDDGLRTFGNVFVHHADMYDMKSIGLTWNNLILQYQQSFDFAKANSKVIEWGKAGQEGCFEGCIGEIYDWYLRTNPSAQNEPQGLEPTSEAGTSQPQVKEFLALEEALTYAGNNIPNWADLKAEAAIAEMKKIVKIKDVDEFPDDEAMVMLVDIYCFEFEDEQKQIAFDAKRKRKAEQDKKVGAFFDRAKNQLKYPKVDNLDSYLRARTEALAVLTQEPLKVSVLDKFHQAVETHTQLDNLINSYKQKPLAEMLDTIHELEDALQKQLDGLPKKVNFKDPEFVRVYSGPGGGLVVLTTAVREQKQKIRDTIEAVAKAELKEERHELQKSIKSSKKLGNEQELIRQREELEIVQAEEAKLKAEHEADKALQAIVKKTRSDVGEIKKEIKDRLRKLHDAKERYVASPENEAVRIRCNELMQEIEGLNGQLDQKFLVLTSTKEPHIAEALKIREDLHIDKLVANVGQNVGSAKSAIEQASEAHKAQQAAEQQRQLQAQLARQVEEATRLQQERDRIAAEKARIEEEKRLAKLVEEEQARLQRVRAAEQQEASRKAQEQERKAQEDALRAAAAKELQDRITAEQLAAETAAAEKLAEQKAAAAQKALTEQREAEARKEAEVRKEAEAKVRIAQQREADAKKAQEAALKAAAIEKAATDKVKADAEQSEQQRLAAERVRMAEEGKRLQGEKSSLIAIKPREDQAALEAERNAQESARLDQERARAAQMRELEVERQRQEQEEQRNQRIRKAIADQGLKRTTERLRIQDTQDKSVNVAPPVFDDKHLRLGTLNRIFTRFGDNQAEIQQNLRNMYQGKRTEKKLKGLLQRFAVNTGHTFANKRDRQIGDLAALMERLQQEGNALSAHEKGVILSGALQSVIDSIQSTESNNMFQSRLLTICKDLKAELHGAGVHDLDTSAKICCHAYKSGGIESFRAVAHSSSAPRQNLG